MTTPHTTTKQTVYTLKRAKVIATRLALKSDSNSYAVVIRIPGSENYHGTVMAGLDEPTPTNWRDIHCYRNVVTDEEWTYPHASESNSG